MEFCVKLLSLPLWERGLKSPEWRRYWQNPGSLPLWERGLKCLVDGCVGDSVRVAPLVGAWIEIPYCVCAR